MAELYDDRSEQEDDDEFEEEEELEDDESEEETGVAQQPTAALSVLFRGRTDTLIDPLVEKVFEFSINLIIQRFSRESLHSPLLYFASVMGIDLKNGGFRRASNYTPTLAGLLWIMRLLILEYALPKRAYVTLRRPSREAYEDHSTRLEEFRRPHLIQTWLSSESSRVRSHFLCSSRVLLWIDSNFRSMLKIDSISSRSRSSNFEFDSSEPILA